MKQTAPAATKPAKDAGCAGFCASGPRVMAVSRRAAVRALATATEGCERNCRHARRDVGAGFQQRARRGCRNCELSTSCAESTTFSSRTYRSDRRSEPRRREPPVERQLPARTPTIIPSRTQLPTASNAACAGSSRSSKHAQTSAIVRPRSAAAIARASSGARAMWKTSKCRRQTTTDPAHRLGADACSPRSRARQTARASESKVCSRRADMSIGSWRGSRS